MAAPKPKEFKIALGLCLEDRDMRALGVDVNCLNDIQDLLWVHLCRVLSHPRAKVHNFTPCVNWTTTADEVTDHDLVVYFVESPAGSIIRSLGAPIMTGDNGGFTSSTLKDGTISEVYVRQNFPARKLANIAFHELMHNKLRRGNEMHGLRGLNMGVSPATECSFLSPRDVELMAQGLNAKVRQYTGRLTGDVAAKFLNPPQRQPAAKFFCAEGSP